MWTPNPRDWVCQACNMRMRVEKMTDDGNCPRCGGRVRREV